MSDFFRDASENLVKRDGIAGPCLANKERVFGIQSSIPEFKASRRDLPSETVFRALDGQDVDVDGVACQVKVCGIYDAGGHRWVQLSLGGKQPRMMTIRLGAEPIDLVSYM